MKSHVHQSASTNEGSEVSREEKIEHSVIEKMQSMARSTSIDGKVDAIREAAGYLKRKEALPSKLKDRLSRRAVDDGLPACMSSCDMDFQSLADITDFCSSKCWNSCPSW